MGPYDVFGTHVQQLTPVEAHTINLCTAGRTAGLEASMREIGGKGTEQIFFQRLGRVERERERESGCEVRSQGALLTIALDVTSSASMMPLFNPDEREPLVSLSPLGLSYLRLQPSPPERSQTKI